MRVDRGTVVLVELDPTGELGLDRAEYLRALEQTAATWPEHAPPASFDVGMPEGPPAWTGIMPRFGCPGGVSAASVTCDGRVVAELRLPFDTGGGASQSSPVQPRRPRVLRSPAGLIVWTQVLPPPPWGRTCAAPEE